jgi:hypothetical protein
MAKRDARLDLNRSRRAFLKGISLSQTTNPRDLMQDLSQLAPPRRVAVTFSINALDAHIKNIIFSLYNLTNVGYTHKKRYFNLILCRALERRGAS